MIFFRRGCTDPCVFRRRRVDTAAAELQAAKQKQEREQEEATEKEFLGFMEEIAALGAVDPTN